MQWLLAAILVQASAQAVVDAAPTGTNSPEAAPQVVPAPSPNLQAAESDPLLFTIDKLSEPEWQGAPLEVYVNDGTTFGMINGKAVPVPGAESPSILREFGCTHVLVKPFTRPQRTVQANIYTFSSSLGAYGAYSCLRKGSSNVVSRGDGSSEDDNSVSFWKDKRFVYINGSADDDDLSKTLVSTVADQIARSINADASVSAPINRMSYLDRIAGSEKLFMGPIAARRFGNVPYIDSLSIEQSRCAAFADFQFPPPQGERMRAMVVDFALPSSAQTAFANYSQAVTQNQKASMLSSNDMMAKLSSGYLMCSLRGKRVIVVSGAKHKQSAPMLVRQLSF